MEFAPVGCRVRRLRLLAALFLQAPLGEGSPRAKRGLFGRFVGRPEARDSVCESGEIELMGLLTGGLRFRTVCELRASLGRSGRGTGAGGGCRTQPLSWGFRISVRAPPRLLLVAVPLLAATGATDVCRLLYGGLGQRVLGSASLAAASPCVAATLGEPQLWLAGWNHLPFHGVGG